MVITEANELVGEIHDRMPAKSGLVGNRFSMSALERFADSGQTSRQVRDVPMADIDLQW